MHPRHGHSRALPTDHHRSRAEFIRDACDNYSILILADRMTLAHFSVSLAISSPNCADVMDSGRRPKPTRRARVSGSATMALISLFSLSTMAAGVAAGAQMPNQPLAS